MCFLSSFLLGLAHVGLSSPIMRVLVAPEQALENRAKYGPTFAVWQAWKPLVFLTLHDGLLHLRHSGICKQLEIT